MYDVARHFCISTPPVLAYHSGLLMTSTRGSLRNLVWQIAHVEWAVFSSMSFLYASRYAMPINSKSVDWRFYDDSDVPGAPSGRLFALLMNLVQFLRGLGIQNLVRATKCMRSMSKSF